LINTLAINVIERTREIGMIRAVGGTRAQVRRMILAESLLLSAAGTGFGILAGLWLGYAIVSAISMMGINMPYTFSAAGVLAAIGVGLIFGVLASTIPARQAARLDIIAALHYE
jgi:putative ABC transport system permease protein